MDDSIKNSLWVGPTFMCVLTVFTVEMTFSKPAIVVNWTAMLKEKKKLNQLSILKEKTTLYIQNKQN